MIKITKVTLLTLIFILNSYAAHPQIYTTNEQKGEIKDKIRSNQWAGANYESLMARVEPYIKRHKSEPEWIVSRLQMYWVNKYQDVFVNGSVFSHGEGKSPVPTPKFAGGRDWTVDYLTPTLEDVKPYMDDERGMWLQNGKKEGSPWEWAPLDKTGQIIERINERIMSLAQDAAFIYWLTGDEDYAKFAADIFWTYTNGMYHRNNPKTFKDDRSKGIVGLATFEVIHEAVTVYLAVTYDYIYDYLVKNGRDVKIVDAVFKRWADRIIEGGGSGGNWNINQARYIVYMGLALDDNDKYADGKGRQYYLDSFLRTSRPNQKALPDVVNDEYDPDTAVWPEAPGYAFSVTETILKLARIIQNATGNDILKDFPIVERAYLAYFQYLFPNGYSIGFGDAYHETPETEPLELLIRLYRDRGDEAMENVMTSALREQTERGYDRSKNNSVFSLTAFCGRLKQGQASFPLQTPTYYSRPVNMFIMRSGDDENTAMCATLTGTAGGHVQANGMTIELYGLGMVMAPDGGRGSSYWQKDHGEYYSKFTAHNTVIVDGISNYDPHAGQYEDARLAAYRIVSCEPHSGVGERMNEYVSFVDAVFVEPKTDSDQRRQLALIRTCPDTGYYVDIFRSARRDGKDKFHDYVYHNIGTLASITDMSGEAIKLDASNRLSSKAGLLKGYDYFSDEKSSVLGGDFFAVFEAKTRTDKTAAMRMWSAAAQGTTLFTVQSPPSRATLRGSIPTKLADKPLSTVILRRNGQSWTNPFVSVYEPFLVDNGASIKEIRQLSNDKNLTALEVIGKNGRQIILSSDCDYRRFDIQGIKFEGDFAVVAFDDENKLEYIYLGRGRYLSVAGFVIDAGENLSSACINFADTPAKLSADNSLRITFPVASNSVKITVESPDGVKSSNARYIGQDGNFGVSVRINECYNASVIEMD